jgi:hypothetical protein
MIFKGGGEYDHYYYDRDGEPMARVPKVARWPNFNGTSEKLRLLKILLCNRFAVMYKQRKIKKKKNYTLYKMFVKNSKKQIIYFYYFLLIYIIICILCILKMTIFLMVSYFSSTYVCESYNELNWTKRNQCLTNETIAACVSLRLTKM